MSSENYKKSGVNILAGEALVKMIQKDNSHVGGFAGLYPLNDSQSLVACTDGVGTKLELSIEMKRYQELGQDLVAMSVNDLICCGAKPLFFLDYFATGKLDVDVTYEVIRGIQNACKESECVLLGGETAEMPGFYKEGQFDLAGFAVGLVENQKLIDGRTLVKGDVLVGIKSSGFHANGYSLVRKILKDENLKLDSKIDGKSLGELLTEPTRLYVKTIAKLLGEIPVKAMAHITGGGLTNIGRVIPKGLTYKVEHKSIPTPAVMTFLKEKGRISQEEAFTVWNMGMGFVIGVDKNYAQKITQLIPDSFIVGEIVSE